MSSLDVKNSDFLDQIPILPKKKTPVPGLVRARFSKARPNIRPLASKPPADVLLRQENSKTAKHNDTSKGPSSNLHINVSPEEKVEQDLTPSVKNLEDVLLRSKTTHHENACKEPSSNSPLNISLEGENGPNLTSRVENLEDDPVSKTTQCEDTCKGSSSKLSLKISSEENHKEDLAPIVKNVENVSLSSKTKQSEDTQKDSSSNLPLNISLEEEYEQNLTPSIENLEDLTVSSKTKQHEEAYKGLSSNSLLDTTLQKKHDQNLTTSVKNQEDEPLRPKRHYEAAFEKESLSTVDETPGCSLENLVSNSSKCISKKTAKPRKKFANACLTSPASARDTNSDNHDEVTIDENDPQAVINDTKFVPSKKVSKSSRKRAASKKTGERKKRARKAKEAPPRNQMRMVDLIDYIPDGAPMKYKESETNVDEEVRPNDNSVPVEEKEEDVSGPRVVIGENGEIMIDEASLVVCRKKDEYESSAAVVENDNTTYTSFRKLVTNKWTLKETLKFYQALVLVGTDFALMELVFKNNWKIAKSRHELKLKFKREERHNAKFVYRAMYESSTWDISVLQDSCEDLSDSSEVDEPSMNQNKTQSDEVEKKHRDTRDEITVEIDSVVV